MKLCKKCYFNKNNSSFGRNKRSKDGRKNVCRQCEYENELKRKAEGIRKEPDVYLNNEKLVLYIRQLLDKEISRRKLNEIYYEKNKNLTSEKFLSSKLFDKKVCLDDDLIKY